MIPNTYWSVATLALRLGKKWCGLSIADDALAKAISLKHGLTSHDVWQGHGARRCGQQNNVR
jgi:hypothetical protein